MQRSQPQSSQNEIYINININLSLTIPDAWACSRFRVFIIGKIWDGRETAKLPIV